MGHIEYYTRKKKPSSLILVHGTAPRVIEKKIKKKNQLVDLGARHCVEQNQLVRNLCEKNKKNKQLIHVLVFGARHCVEQNQLVCNPWGRKNKIKK